MMSSLLPFAGILILLAMLPLAVKRIQRHMGSRGNRLTHASAVVSAVAVGPQQRVVTVEVGPEGNRTWLVLGVTAQSVTLLHSLAGIPAQDESSASA